jgi:hypothetical protein
MEKDNAWKELEKSLQKEVKACREDGDLINRYLTHKEVMNTLFWGDPMDLTHQFVRTKERGIVRNHSKALKKSIGEIEELPMPNIDEYISKLNDIIEFLGKNKPAKGRKAKKTEVGTTKKVRLNKRQGYAIIPDVGRMFGIEPSEEGYEKEYCMVEYVSNTEIVIRPHSLTEMSEEEIDSWGDNEDG